VGALTRPANQPDKPVNRRSFDPVAAQRLAEPRQQQRRALVLERLFDQAALAAAVWNARLPRQGGRARLSSTSWWGRRRGLLLDLAAATLAQDA